MTVKFCFSTVGKYLASLTIWIYRGNDEHCNCYLCLLYLIAVFKASFLFNFRLC